MNKRSGWREPELWLGAWTLALMWIGFSLAFGSDMLGHNPRDSFTLMAIAWRNGKLSLGQDYPWLELAIFNNDWYVSFPSVPALVLLPFTVFFGEQTPNTLLTGFYFLGSYFAAYFLCRRWRKPAHAAFMALFMTAGCSLFDFSLSGGVWNQAQLLCLFLTVCFAYGISGESPFGWGVGLFCLALSVGCRPFQAVYVPFGLMMLYSHIVERGNVHGCKAVLRMLPYLIAPALVALALGWYNWVRFGNPLEFGHNYLPEFTRNPDQPQLGLQYVRHNIENLLRLPEIVDHHLEFPRFDGFAFWLVNPMFVSATIAGLLRLTKRVWDRWDSVLLVSFIAEIFLLLMHKTFGGWQFGARYLCDLIPMLLLFELRGQKDTPAWEAAIGIFAIAFNIVGTIAFRLMDMGVW